jgi:hypothetical protein
MILQELLDKIEKVNSDKIIIKFYDENMNMEREIDPNNFDKFIAINGNVEIRTIIPIDYRIVVKISNPNK